MIYEIENLSGIIQTYLVSKYMKARLTRNNKYENTNGETEN